MTGFRQKAAVVLATGLFSGYMPVASGTFGTLVGIPGGYLVSRLGLVSAPLVVAFVTLVAVWSAGVAEDVFGQKDSGRIVIDEIAGFLVTMLFIPWRLETVIAGFLVFRFMDILKPFPIRSLETRLPDGWGVVGDDVLAGFYANVVLRILLVLKSVA